MNGNTQDKHALMRIIKHPIWKGQTLEQIALDKVIVGGQRSRRGSQRNGLRRLQVQSKHAGRWKIPRHLLAPNASPTANIQNGRDRPGQRGRVISTQKIPKNIVLKIKSLTLLQILRQRIGNVFAMPPLLNHAMRRLAGLSLYLNVSPLGRSPPEEPLEHADMNPF